MTKKEFFDKHHIQFETLIEEIAFLDALDALYLGFTTEQVRAIVDDYLSNADDIYNDMKEVIRERINELEGRLKEIAEDELDKTLDKKIDA